MPFRERSGYCISKVLCLAFLLMLPALNLVAQECVIPSPDLVSWWPLDEASGTLSGELINDNSGIHRNGPVPTDGLVDGSLRFDGANDFVGVPDSDLWAFGSQDFTIELWANFDTLGGGSIGHPGDIFIGNDEGGGTRRKWFFALGGGFLNFHINGPGLGPQFFPRAPFAPVVDQWYHLAVTRSDNTYTLYIDGKAVASAVNSAVIQNANAALTIGQAENLGYMNGRLDEISIYRSALSAVQIEAIAQAGELGKCKNVVITSSPSLAFKLGTLTSFQFETAASDGSITWNFLRGRLPPGLEFDGDGLLSGTPSELGTFTFTVEVTDGGGDTAEATIEAAIVPILPPADVRINLSTTSLVPGRVVDQFILVENKGNREVTDTPISMWVDPSQQIVVSADPPLVLEVSDAQNTGQVAWSIPSIPPRGKVVLLLLTEIRTSVSIGDFLRTFLCFGDATFDIMRACFRDLGGAVFTCSCLDSFCLIGTSGGRPDIRLCAGCLAACGLFATPSYFACVKREAEARYEDVAQCARPDLPATGPVDPNEKVVVANRFIRPDQTLVYPIHFENIGEVEAKDVFVSDVLQDSVFDLSTLEILTPGAKFDEASRTIRWELLDRNLEPGETDNVLFSISPLPDLPTGTELRNAAEIQFEIFEPIVTDEVLNIIDTTLPTCEMNQLPDTVATVDFEIAWSSEDEIGEVRGHTIYVSEGDDLFIPFVENTRETKAMFNGENGRSYRFLCVAADTAGNAEDQSLVAETSTRVVIEDGDVVGDFNEDRCVDRSDYSLLIEDIRVAPEPFRNPDFDLNGDGIVNRSDARTLVGLFTNPRGVPCE